MDRRAKIVATFGPASHAPEIIERLFKAGINVARLNFSHGSYVDHAEVIGYLRSISERMQHPLAILQDLQGPKIRVGVLTQPLELTPGEPVMLFAQDDPNPNQQSHIIPVDFSELFSSVHAGDRILLDDGRIELNVIQVEGRTAQAQVKSGGVLTSHKGINLPGVSLAIRGFTDKDKKDLAFGLSQNVDMVAISFVRNANDVSTVRSAMAELGKGGQSPLLIAKLERPEALENLDEILEASDGVMVARGDLGVEIPPERVPTAQKRIILNANNHRKLVITATQMLDSMISNPLPSRAEASDVANAIYDGTDAVMLSGETASGQYPVESVLMMDRIVRESERNFTEWGNFKTPDYLTEDDAVAITRAACELAHDLNVAAIAVFTQTGRTALLMSKMRPRVPIYAFTPNGLMHHRLAAMWGVNPVLVPMAGTLREMVRTADRILIESDTVQKGNQVVVISGFPVEAIRPPNMALLHTIGEEL
jgi:pyruvate kinase